jgi:hypothetical protein
MLRARIPKEVGSIKGGFEKVDFEDVIEIFTTGAGNNFDFSYQKNFRRTGVEKKNFRNFSGERCCPEK